MLTSRHAPTTTLGRHLAPGGAAPSIWTGAGHLDRPTAGYRTTGCATDLRHVHALDRVD